MGTGVIYIIRISIGMNSCSLKIHIYSFYLEGSDHSEQKLLLNFKLTSTSKVSEKSSLNKKTYVLLIIFFSK